MVTTYTVHEGPAPVADRIDRGAELEFVKDGFSWLTAICPPLGFAAGGLWLAALAYVLGASVLAWALTAAKVGPGWTALFLLALNLYLGFERSSLKRWFLDRKGWITLGVVNGKSIADCERRFLEGWLPAQPIIANASQARSEPSVPQYPRTSSLWPFGGRG